MSDLKYFPRKQKAPEYPLRLEADRQSAIQWKDYRTGFINRRLKIFMTRKLPMQKIASNKRWMHLWSVLVKVKTPS